MISCDEWLLALSLNNWPLPSNVQLRSSSSLSPPSRDVSEYSLVVGGRHWCFRSHLSRLLEVESGSAAFPFVRQFHGSASTCEAVPQFCVDVLVGQERESPMCKMWNRAGEEPRGWRVLTAAARLVDPEAVLRTGNESRFWEHHWAIQIQTSCEMGSHSST